MRHDISIPWGAKTELICRTCGKKYTVSTRQVILSFRLKGLHPAFCSRSCFRAPHLDQWRTSENASRAGRIGNEHKRERIRQKFPDGVNREVKGYIRIKGRHEHRIIAERILGRSLNSSDVIHHKDGDPHNNDPSNLELHTHSSHAQHHLPEVARRVNAQRKGLTYEEIYGHERALLIKAKLRAGQARKGGDTLNPHA